MKYFLGILLLGLGSSFGYAQYRYKSEISEITQSGYYNIRLSQEAIALSKKTDLSDLRIKDEQGNEVPYLLRSDEPMKGIDRFIDCEISQSIEQDSINRIVVSNKDNNYLSRLYVTVRKADVKKDYVVRGSDDQKKWYIVKQRSVVNNISQAEDGTETLIIDFPKGNFTYYEIELINNQRNPLDIIRVERLTNYDIYGNYVEFYLGRFVQKDSIDKKSYITFPNVKDNYRINKIVFVIKNEFNYYRDVIIQDDNNYSNFVLSSKLNNDIEFNENTFQTANVCLSICNNDNPPLVIDSIKAFGLSRYLSAYLEAGKKYTLFYGDKKAAIPQYDIVYFRNELPDNMPIIGISDAQLIPHKEDIKEKLWIENPFFMWSAIIIVGLFITFLCIRMMRDISRKNEN